MQPSAAQRVAVAPFSRDLLRSRFGGAFCFRELFWQLQSGCEAGFAEGKTATSCATVRSYLRYLRFFLMDLEPWKHTVIQFRSKTDIKNAVTFNYSRLQF